jgi:hypothetical protein
MHRNFARADFRVSDVTESRDTHSLLRTTLASDFSEIIVNSNNFERSEFGATGGSISLAAQRDMGSFRNRGHLPQKVTCPSACTLAQI